MFNEAAMRIRETYERNLEQLPPKERIHFIRRAYRITGSQELAAQMRAWTTMHTVPAVQRRASVLQKVADGAAPFPPVRFKRKAAGRVLARNELLSERPELQFFRRYTMDLFQAKSIGANRTVLSGQWSSYIETLQRFDFDEMYVDLQVIDKISSFAVNTVIFLDYLDVDHDLHRRFLGYLKGAYLTDELDLAHELSRPDYTTLIYNLTHMIIGYSRFYQEWVAGHSWAGEFFARNASTILERCSFDVVAEVGLSLKLMRLDSTWATQYQDIRNYIAQEYDFEKALSPRNLARQEHTNAVIMLLFADVSSWHKGPTL